VEKRRITQARAGWQARFGANLGSASAFLRLLASKIDWSIRLLMWIEPSRSLIVPCGCFCDFFSALDHRDAFDAGALLGGEDLEHFAGLALVGAGDDDDLVVAFDVKFLAMLENLRSERDDLHEVLRAQFAGDRSEDAGALGLLVASMMTIALLSKRR
jgi:hypothetical protein